MGKKNQQTTIDDTPTLVLDALPDRSADEGLQILLKRQAALETRLQESEERLAAIREELATSNGSNNIAFLSTALLESPTASISATDNLQGELSKLDKLCEALRHAVRRGDREILQYKAELDAQACREVLSIHRRNVRATVNAVLDLHLAVLLQDELRKDLSRRGVDRTGHLPALFPPDFLIGMDDPNSWLTLFMQEALDLGFISGAEHTAVMRGDLALLDLEK